jgi:signal transduction histidine kinase
MGPVYFLLVDDHKENFLALEALLRRDNLVFLKATSGTDALELLLKYEVALALIDVQMPDMNGFELAELMRGSERTKTVPIIFVTAGETDQSRRFRGYEAGAVDFITKPVEPDILKSKADVFFRLYLQHLTLSLHRDELAAAIQENQQLLSETRRYAEMLKLSNDRKNEFLATLGHELRNPLTPLRVGLDILQQSPEPETCAKTLNTMTRQLNHMVCLIDDLLDMSRVSEGKIELNLTAVSLQDALTTTLETCANTISSRHHTVTVDMPGQTIWVNADPIRLEQIIVNLINNAAKYTPDGGKLSFNVGEEGPMGWLSITDNGIGIPEEMRTSIFDLFTQINCDNSNDNGRSANDRSDISRSEGGLGIGLSLVKKLLALHDGHIVVTSEGLNKGSTFTIYLPTGEPAEADNSRTETASTQTAIAQALQILIVDDNVPAAETTGIMIELLGHKIELAFTGPEALQRAQSTVPDVILLDISLPEMNGYQVAKALRKDSHFDRCLLIAQTGWGRDSDRQAAFAAGFDHFLIKPLNLESLQPLLKPRGAIAVNRR